MGPDEALFSSCKTDRRSRQLIIMCLMKLFILEFIRFYLLQLFVWTLIEDGWRNMQIFGYRMSLWAEHIGTVEECFTSPHSLECMRRVRDLGQLNWKQFVADDITEMRGHLLKYPVDVDKKGMVKPLPGFETFPDIGGNICGSFFGIQENLTI